MRNKKYKALVISKSEGCNIQYREYGHNTAMTLYGDKWLLNLSWGSFLNICKFQITKQYTSK